MLQKRKKDNQKNRGNVIRMENSLGVSVIYPWTKVWDLFEGGERWHPKPKKNYVDSRYVADAITEETIERWRTTYSNWIAHKYEEIDYSSIETAKNFV